MKSTFEQNMAQLNEVVTKLSSGGCGLEEAIELYEQGKKLLETCEIQLNSAQVKLTVAEQKDV